MDRKNTLALHGGQPVAREGGPSWPETGQLEASAVGRVALSGKWGLEGDEQFLFAEEFSRLQNVGHTVPVANGTVALQLALEALDIGRGDEVIVPSLTWQATAAAVLDVNALPIFADILPETYCINPKAVEAKITRRTKAVIVVHLYGSMADLDAFNRIASKHNLALIEDCAHAHGGRWAGWGAGAVGIIGTFSYQSSKTLTSGEGGAVVTADPVLADRLISAANAGRRPERPLAPEQWSPIQSGNYRLSALQAGLLRAQMQRFRAQHAARTAMRPCLDRVASQFAGIYPMSFQPRVTVPISYKYVFRVDAGVFDGVSVPVLRKALAAELRCEVVGPYEPLTESPYYLPHTKRRHHIDPDYWMAIAPSPDTGDVTVARTAWERALCLEHSFMRRPEAHRQLEAALTKLAEHVDELRDIQLGAG